MTMTTDGQAPGARAGTEAEARAVAYLTLARCFSYPEPALVELFGGGAIEELLPSWRGLGLDASATAARAAAWIEEQPGPDAALLELEKEYTRLFVNTTMGKTIPPYSSVYLNDDRIVWSESSVDALKLYTAAGLAPARDFLDAPDHITAEMEFASHLAEEREKAEQAEPARAAELASIEEKFLKDHFFRWAPVFFGQVAEAARTVFYRELALLAKQFVDWDAVRG